MKKILIPLVLVGFLTPGLAWAARAVFWVPMADCGDPFSCVFPEIRCKQFLTIGDSSFGAPIKVKVIQKQRAIPNKKGRIASEFIQNETESTYNAGLAFDGRWNPEKMTALSSHPLVGCFL